MNARAWIQLAVLALGLTAPALAAAQVTSGWVTGTILYSENNGNFCDSAGQGQNCADTTYTSAHFGQERAIKDAKVVIFGGLNGSPFPWVVGTGKTNSIGVFKTSWTSATAPDFIFLGWTAEHDSGIFRILDTNGNIWTMASSIPFTPAAGTNSTNPQSMDLLGDPNVWGSPGNGHQVANVYAMAHLMSASLRENAFLNSAFTNVEIRAFYGPPFVGPIGQCPSACAGFVGNVATGQATVQLTQADAFMPQARILHELGHIASRRLNWRRLMSDYCWPDRLAGTTPPSCFDADGDGVNAQTPGWSLASPNSGEWMNDAFEEGLATFMGDRAIYRQTAVSPTTCISSAACPASTPGNWVEFSTGNGVLSACGQLSPNTVNQPQFLRRSAMITDRYLRDVYDNSNDSAACPPGDATCQLGRTHNDTLARSWAEVLEVIRRFPNGVNDHQDEEPFINAGTNNIDDPDGVRVHDFVFVYSSVGSPIVGTNTARQYNCTAY